MTATGTDVDLDVDEPASRWGVVDVLGAFVVAQIASFFGLLVFAAAKGIPVEDFTTDALTIGEVALLQVPLWIGFLGVPLLSTWRRGRGPVRELGLWTTLRDAPIGLAIGIACQFVLVPLVTLPVFLLTDVDQEELEAPAREITEKAHGMGVLVLVLVVVVGAPLAEEVFYRGFLQRAMARKLPIWPTMVITALLFGASHLQALQFPALAAFGLVLSIIAHRTGRLGMNIWAHVGFNATTVVLLLARG
ncbi:CPBP family intramembrane glutamic endopeptidase [Actinospongicola halichondriae]|uniref:CPBP family intramembrane glutamic endopeptidase n=1 Tax=Actinospongicola halichondriae TaxID=3236844 RepID=UPI003D3B094B